MGRTHATTGSVSWVVACAGTDAVAAHEHLGLVGWPTLLVGAVVCAGFAVVPDADHPRSTLACTWGPLSREPVKVFARVCAVTHGWSRTRYDRPDEDGHRTWTHTGLFALLAGGVVAGGAWALGARGWVLGLWLVYVAVALMVRATIDGDDLVELARDVRLLRRSAPELARSAVRFLGPHVLAALVAGGVWLATPPAAGWGWLGVPVGAGCLVHVLGDMLTITGCPFWAPFVKFKGQRWHICHLLPKGLRLSTGSRSKGERRINRASVVVTVAAAGYVAYLSIW